MNNSGLQFPHWRDKDGNIISCVEKLKVMRENFTEIQLLMKDAFEDGILMDVSEEQMRDVLTLMVSALNNPYRKK